MANVGVCRLCNAEGVDLIKAHIISRAFFNNLPEKGKVDTYKISGEKERRLQNAWYDSEILCNDCEKKVMAPLDDYAITIVRDKKGSSPYITPGGRERLLIFSEVDRFGMRAFLASLLWRLSVSNQVEIRSVCIGEHYVEKISRELLGIRNVGLEQLDEAAKDSMFSYIDAVIYSFLDQAHAAFTTPVRCKIPVLEPKRDSQPVNGWWVNMPFFQMLISLDQRRHPARAYFDLEGLYQDISISLNFDSKSKRWAMFQLDKNEGTIDLFRKTLTKS